MNKDCELTMNNSIECIKEVVSITTRECFGVVGIAKKNTTDDIVDLFKKENYNKGVRVKFNEDGKLIIDLYIIIAFGVKAAVVAENLMDSIKYNVEKQSDYKVKKINVYVQSVRA